MASMEFSVREHSAASTRHAGTIPHVSIVIPSYNHERFVARAIESVFAQTYQNFEITLVNFRVRDRQANVSADTPENFRRGQYESIKILDHFLSPDALAQLHLMFPEFADQVFHEHDAVRQHVLKRRRPPLPNVTGKWSCCGTRVPGATHARCARSGAS
jgi:cellulose synthase/poly-beta-1,6-N-acetylglucosamine synthase-like glycosyltransferase